MLKKKSLIVLVLIGVISLFISTHLKEGNENQNEHKLSECYVEKGFQLKGKSTISMLYFIKAYLAESDENRKEIHAMRIKLAMQKIWKPVYNVSKDKFKAFKNKNGDNLSKDKSTKVIIGDDYNPNLGKNSANVTLKKASNNIRLDFDTSVLCIIRDWLFLPNNDYILTTSYEGKGSAIRIWSDYGELLSSLYIQGRYFFNAEISCDGKTVMVNTYNPFLDKNSKEFENYKEVYKIYESERDLPCATKEDLPVNINKEKISLPLSIEKKAKVAYYIFSPNKELVATVGNEEDAKESINKNNIISIWNAKTGELISSSISCHLNQFLRLAFSQNNKFIASSIGNYATIWDIDSSKQIYDLENNQTIYDMVWHKNNKVLIIMTSDSVSDNAPSMLNIWDIEATQQIIKPKIIEQASGKICYSRDSENIIIYPSCNDYDTYRLFPLYSSKDLTEESIEFLETYYEDISGVKINKKGSFNTLSIDDYNKNKKLLKGKYKDLYNKLIH